MTTTAWRATKGTDSRVVNPLGESPRVEGSRVLDMTVARRFVVQVLGGDGASDLTDSQWAELCRTAENSNSDQLAVAQVVLKAYALRNVENPFGARRGFSDVVGPLSSAASISAPNILPPQEPVRRPAINPVSVPSEFTDPNLSTFFGFEGHPPSKFDDVEQGPRPLDAADWSISYGQNPNIVQPSTVPPSVQPRQIRQARSFVHFRKRVHAKSRIDALDDRSRARWLTVASWVRNIGAIILLFVAWQLWGTAITEHHSQEALTSQFETRVHHSVVKSGFALIPATTRLTDPPDGSAMAQLQIPKIGLNQIVVSGTDQSDLAKGPGHYLGTAMPGQAGNVAIAGHRTTHGAPFNRLAELAIGDPVYLTTLSGQRLTYIVSAAPVAVSPKDVTVLNNFGDDRLTLTTCNPEYSAVQRLIVVAAYLPPGASHPLPMAKGDGQPYALAPSAVSGWNTNLLPLVFLEVGALVALGLLYRRFAATFGKEGRWIILFPVWLALLLALFETLTNFLPAAV